MLSILFPRLHRFVAARLSPEEATGLHMTIGLALLVAAAWVFGGIAEDVVDGDDIPGTVDAVRHAVSLDRDVCRAHAVQHCSVERMVDEYVRIYNSMRTLRGAA